jgi:enoyl-CoA hydratase
MGIVNKVVPDQTVVTEALETAHNIAKAGERAVRLTKQAINSSYEAMGFNQALKSSLNLDILLNAAPDPLKEKFSRIRNEKGLKAAIEWRDNRFTHKPK